MKLKLLAAVLVLSQCLFADVLNTQGPLQNNLDIIYYIPVGQHMPVETVLDWVGPDGTHVNFYYGISGYNAAVAQTFSLVDSGIINPLNMRAQYEYIWNKNNGTPAPEPGTLGLLGLGVVAFWRKVVK